jgi:hypothetical protein
VKPRDVFYLIKPLTSRWLDGSAIAIATLGRSMNEPLNRRIVLRDGPVESASRWCLPTTWIPREARIDVET